MAHPADVNAIREIADDRRVIRVAWFFPHAWLEKWVRLNQMSVAEIDGKVVGFMHFSSRRIHFLIVHPAYRNQGIGSDLVRSVDVPTVWALKNGTNFWRRLGYVETDKVKGGKKPRVLMVKLGSQKTMEGYV